MFKSSFDYTSTSLDSFVPLSLLTPVAHALQNV
jgi:hypothetical protein